MLSLLLLRNNDTVCLDPVSLIPAQNLSLETFFAISRAQKEFPTLFFAI